MSTRFAQLVAKMTHKEQVEVYNFATFVLARRQLPKDQLLMASPDISTEELMRLVMESGGFDWLDADQEDVYSIEDGEAIEWPGA